MHVLGWNKFKCFVYPASHSYVSHSIDICARNMYAVTTYQIGDI